MSKTMFLRAARDWTDDSVSIMVTPSITAKAMFHYVQEIGYYRCLPAYFTERENLPSFLIVYTLSGKGFLRYKGQRFPLERGQAFFIDCMEYQYYETDPEDLWELLWVHFHGSTSKQYYEQFLLAGDPVMTLNPQSPVPSLLHKLFAFHQNKDARTELLSSQTIVEILTDLLLHTLSRNHQPHVRFLPDYIQQTQHYLEEQLQEKITLDQLSLLFSVSKYHLAREFKVYTGLTPNEYLINQRINKGKKLLRYSDIPVSEVAKQVGFENTSHFINQFKKQEDTTPLNFRKTWQRPK
jgi:AraC-like DNA-binding protein